MKDVTQTIQHHFEHGKMGDFTLVVRHQIGFSFYTRKL